MWKQLESRTSWHGDTSMLEMTDISRDRRLSADMLISTTWHGLQEAGEQELHQTLNLKRGHGAPVGVFNW